MVKTYKKRVAAKLTGDKQTSVWISGKHLPMIKDWGLSNQAFAQAVFDIAMGFIVNIDLKTGVSKVIDPSGKKVTKEDKERLAKILAAEIVRNFEKENIEQ